jgi:hypothetical protein
VGLGVPDLGPGREMVDDEPLQVAVAVVRG